MVRRLGMLGGVATLALALFAFLGGLSPDLAEIESAESTPERKSTDVAPSGEAIALGQNASAGTTSAPLASALSAVSVGQQQLNVANDAPRSSSALPGSSASPSIGAVVDDRSTGLIKDVSPQHDLPPLAWQLHRVQYGQVQAPHTMRLDGENVWEGSKSVEVSAQDAGPPYGTGALQQTIVADEWRGKRLVFSVHLRTRELISAGYAQAFVRAERDDGLVVAFDNLSRHALRANRDWIQLEIVIDIPQSADFLIYGAFLVGPGRMWADSIALSEVPMNKTPTAPPFERQQQNPPADSVFHVMLGPINTDFEDGVLEWEQTYVTSVLPLQ